MIKNNYLNLYSSLTTKEKHLFSNYVQVYCTKKTVLLQIHNYYKKTSRRTLADLEKDYQTIFEEPTATKYVKLSNGLSDLFITLKDFLVQQKVLEKSRIYDVLLSEALKEKKLRKLHAQHRKKMLKKFSTEKKIDLWSPFYQTQLYHDTYFRNGLKTGKKLYLLESGLQTLEDFYEGLRLKYAVEIINVQKVTGQKSTVIDVEKELQKIEKNKRKGSIINQFYSIVFRFLVYPNQKEADELQEFMNKNKALLFKDEQLIGIIHLINFLARQISSGVQGAEKQAFANYKFGLEEQLLIQDQVMDKTVYENIIDVACLCNDFSWAIEFIDNFKKYLPEELREDTYQLALASILFHSGKYKEVLKMLENLELADIFQNLRLRSLRLRTYCELNEIENIENECSTFRRFVKRSKLSSHAEDAALNFIFLLKKITNIDVDFQKLEIEINETEHLFCRSWLLKKIRGGFKGN